MVILLIMPAPRSAKIHGASFGIFEFFCLSRDTCQREQC